MTPLRSKLRGLAIAATLATPVLLCAQVSLYQYSESVQTYTEVTAAQAAYSLGVPTYWPPLHNMRAWVNNSYFGAGGQVTNGGYLSGVYGPGYPIGFNLTYNGDVFDRIGVSNSGWISLGKSSDGDSAVWCYAADHPHGMPFVQYIGGPNVPYKRNRIAGFGSSQLRMQDMSSLLPPGPVSSLLIATIGTAPNRTCVVQFKDFRASYSPSTGTIINFQIRMNEADNSVEVRYGNVGFGYEAGGAAQVGLGGQIPEDFNGRMTAYQQPSFLYDWNTTIADTVNTDYCLATSEQPGHPNGSGIPPVNGRNFKWTPDVCPPPVWPLTINQVSYDSGHASWQANSAGEYEYFVSTANSTSGPEASSGTTTDPEAYFFGLNAATTYYVFVRSICGGQPGPWSLATVFETFGGGMVVCDGTVMTENYCSHTYSTKEWLYQSADLSPLKIEFQAGFVGNSSTESFQVWNGTGPVGLPGFTGSGDITGGEFQAGGGSMYIRLITDAGACEAQPWYLPLQWRIGCKNCQDPLASYTVVEDCPNQQYSVQVNIASMGSSTSVNLDNNLGVTSSVANSTGIHTAGPFPAGQSVVITVQNPDNLMCYNASAPLINEPCALVGCGPTTYTYCYHDNEIRQWAYQGANSQEIGIRFLQGTVGYGDQLQTYNGLDLFSVTPVDLPAGLANSLSTSSNPSHALVLSLTADNSMSCADADPLFGTTQPWKYVVACYDGCTQPNATFSAQCLNQTQYQVNVSVTQLGSTGSVSITNTGGAPAITANALGSYMAGPFTVGQPVSVEVEGASVLCSWSSSELVKSAADCFDVGIHESTMVPITLYPNPSNGSFKLVMPQALGNHASLEVLDLTGRTVARQALKGAGMVDVDLSALPNGLYTVYVQGENNRSTTKISIQH